MGRNLPWRPVSKTCEAPARALELGGAQVRIGTSSWADRSLTRESDFYPARTMTARDRLAFYCGQFPLAEITATYRFPPTPDLCGQWAARTPDSFTFDVRAWSLLTGNPTFPDSLWPDLQPAVRASARDRRRLYASHLPPEVLEECWARFRHALEPLRQAGRLGAVILTYPSWFSPRPDTWDELTRIPERLPGVRAAVELRSPKWFEGDACEETLECLEEAELAFVCSDGPPGGPQALPGVVAATADVAVVRFRGRRAQPDVPWTWPYRYSRGELASWCRPLRDLASSVNDVHVIMDNTWRDDAVHGAFTLAGLLEGEQPDEAMPAAPPRPEEGSD